MKGEYAVWLPPKGDHRLLRYQESLAVKTKWEGFNILPPLMIWPEKEPFPSRKDFPEISCGKWVKTSQRVGLESNVYPGVFCLGFTFDGECPEFELEPPEIFWPKGRLGRLEWQRDLSGGFSWSLTFLKSWL